MAKKKKAAKKKGTKKKATKKRRQSLVILSSESKNSGITARVFTLYFEDEGRVLQRSPHETTSSRKIGQYFAYLYTVWGWF